MKIQLAGKCIKSLFTFICLIFVINAFGEDYVPGEILIKVKSPSHARSFHAGFSSKATLLKSFDELNIHHYRLNAGEDVMTTIEKLKSDPNVIYAEPNHYLHKSSTGPAQNVTSYAHALDASYSSTQGSFSQNEAPTKVSTAWSSMSSSTLVTPIVAVIDTGIDYNHPVFTRSGAVWRNPGETGTDSRGNNKSNNGIDDDGNGFVDDWRGWNFISGTNAPFDDDSHGTHVSGIILGVTQNILSNTISPAKIRIMPLKFLDSSGNGQTSDAISAIYYAAKNGANIISNSWGGSGYDQSLHDALTYAYNAKLFIACAAGNNSGNNDLSPIYPAAYPVPSLLAVAASDDMDVLASFSNYGKNTVSLSAPGVDIYSTLPYDSYGGMSGTSMATPFVAGVAALIFREAPNLTGYQIKNVINATVDQLNGLSSYVFTSGRIDVNASVVEAKSETGIQAIQPQYADNPPAGTRDIASTSAKAGCGLLGGEKTWTAMRGKNRPPPSAGVGMGIAFSFALPMGLWMYLKRRAQQLEALNSGLGRRKYERFEMHSQIKVRIGNRELEGRMNTISEGGLSFEANTMLEKGGVLTMLITSPDGREQLQVQGKVVWNEHDHNYGVQFDESKNRVLGFIRSWTRDLAKAA